MVTEEELTDAIEKAAKKAICDLFQKNNEAFYYCSLITDGEAHAPFLVAWSKEALEREMQKDENLNEPVSELKWSYADSPYCMYCDECFDYVKKLFSKRPKINIDMSDDEWLQEYTFRLTAMEKAMANLDTQGIFGDGDKRLGIVINVEVMPPDYSNTERAIRLNPAEALRDWLIEIAEEIGVSK